jgi:hypothetical protein
MASAGRNEGVGSPRFKPYTRPRIYKHMSPNRHCRICGKTDWCSYSLNEEVSCCTQKNERAHYVSRESGGASTSTIKKTASPPLLLRPRAASIELRS